MKQPPEQNCHIGGLSGTAAHFRQGSAGLPDAVPREVEVRMARQQSGMRTQSLAATLSACLAFSGLSPAAQINRLRIVVLQGEGAINLIDQPSARDLAVEVRDEDDRPVAGAVVVFALPERGASGTFANGASSVTITTDSQGRARATGLRPNGVQGEVPIRVSVSFQGLTASEIIHQTNALSVVRESGTGGGSGRWITMLAIIGGAAAGGVVAATRSSGSQTGNSITGGAAGPPPRGATSISAGAPRVGPPPR
jgi:hypothetical protein